MGQEHDWMCWDAFSGAFRAVDDPETSGEHRSINGPESPWTRFESGLVH